MCKMEVEAIGRIRELRNGGIVKAHNKMIGVAVLVTLGTGSQHAVASGFQLMEQNASGLGNAYAGQAAAAENASTIFYNPAGMTQLPGKQISGTLSIIRPTIDFTDNGASRSPGGAPSPAGGGNGGDAGGWNYIPSGYFSWQLTPRLWAGIGVTAPFGLNTDYDSNYIGRFQSQKAELKTYDFNPSLAFKINDAVSIGGGLSYQHAKLSLDRSFFAGAALAQTVSLSDDSWGWNLGAMFNLGSATRLGLSYRSEMKHDLAGSVTVAGVGNGTAMVSLNLPDTVSIGISHQLADKWQLLGDFTWTHWSRIQNLPLILTSSLGPSPAGTVSDTLDLQFKNSYRVGLGANYRWTDNLMLKLGVAYDATPVPDSTHRTVFLPDSNRTWLAFGAKHQLSKAGVLDVGYAHLFLSDAGIFRNKGVGVAGAQGIVSGNYNESVNIVSIQYSHSF